MEHYKLENRRVEPSLVHWFLGINKGVPRATASHSTYGLQLRLCQSMLRSDLIMSFNEIPEAVWEQMRQRWEDEQLAKQAAGMRSQTN